ncbi:DNA polymerase I [Clostridium akagii]|uniref:DNA polymerase I n=1 Tax=Clostridium akagii TaxID=91623 RepID=UPI00047B0A31|nr:DNA polymerase I [Clostridium akagii]
MERLLILDGHSLMYRAFFALPTLTNDEGINTNAIYGFVNMLFKMKEEIKPDYIVTTFDMKAPTFRHKEYTEYKAGRKKMPPELAEQFPIVKELLEKLAICIFEIEGFEADDLIGTLSVYANDHDIETYIVTGDRDALQLAKDNVKVVINKKGMSEKEIYDKDRMINDYGVTPTQFIDVKGLMGDKSDNIPGVPGIGEKTAYKLIQEYGCIENVLMNIDKISGKKLKENLMQYSEQAIFSKKLATILTNVPIEIDLNEIKSKENYDAKAVRELFTRLQFKRLIEKIPITEEEKAINEVEVECVTIDNIKGLKNLVESVKDSLVYFVFEISNENVYSKIEINKININYESKNYIINFSDIFKVTPNEVTKLLRDLFENESIKKVIHDAKAVYTALSKLKITLKGLAFDTKVAAYLTDASRGEYELKSIIYETLNIDVTSCEELIKVKEVNSLEKISKSLKVKIKLLEMEELLYNVEQPLIEVLASMETRGFNVDKKKLDELGVKFSSEIQKTQDEIYAMAGEEFNISSPKQLGKILFEKLDLPVIKKTKTGFSTKAEVLLKLRDKHPIIDKITYFRQLTKLDSTYVEGLKNVVDVDGRIHSSFNQTVTTTGRLSSTEPNLQNIPIKYEMGREIRKVFIPDEDTNLLMSADYSQIELRVLAHIAGDENLINAFKEHIDIHTKTASEVFNVPIDEVTHDLRSNAKAVNFGIVYGIGEFSLAEDLKISRKEAKLYIDTYLERYPKVKQYLQGIVTKAKEDSAVTTILNRRRAIPEINAKNKMVASFGERLAMNTPIQGSAADIIKIAMVKVYNRLKKEKLKTTIVLQVHDELILNVYEEEQETVANIVKNEMENAIELKVPLEVDINLGKTWYDAK